MSNENLWFYSIDQLLPVLLFLREKTLAKKYYDKLFKEYCITDLSRYRENKVMYTFSLLRQEYLPNLT